VADQTFSDAEQAGLRAELEAERSRLAAHVDELEPATTTGRVDDNFADSGQVAAEQGEHQALASQLRNELDEVERALAKLDDGSYGRCETCGEPIAAPRLEAMPAARFCIDHA
jgi:RNA polymerase-binding transcription factor DksA